MNHSKLHGEASYLRRPKLFKASSRQPRRPPRQPQPPPAAQPPGRAATSTTNRDLRRLLDLRGAATFATNSDPLTSQPPIPLFNQATRQLLMSPPHACKPHWHKISGCPRQRNRTQPHKTQLKVTFLSSRKYFFLYPATLVVFHFLQVAKPRRSKFKATWSTEHAGCLRRGIPSLVSFLSYPVVQPVLVLLKQNEPSQSKAAEQLGPDEAVCSLLVLPRARLQRLSNTQTCPCS